MVEKQRVNVYIPSDIVDAVDRYADKFGASRGVMITIMLQNYIDQQKVLEMSSLVDQLQAAQARNEATR